MDGVGALAGGKTVIADGGVEHPAGHSCIVAGRKVLPAASDGPKIAGSIGVAAGHCRKGVAGNVAFAAADGRETPASGVAATTGHGRVERAGDIAIAAADRCVV